MGPPLCTPWDRVKRLHHLAVCLVLAGVLVLIVPLLAVGTSILIDVVLHSYCVSGACRLLVYLGNHPSLRIVCQLLIKRVVLANVWSDLCGQLVNQVASHLFNHRPTLPHVIVQCFPQERAQSVSR